jgi:hypothetical protein
MTIQSNQSEIVLYKTEDGTVKIDTVFHDETIWLTQKKMAELFDVKRPAITKHLKNIFESEELFEHSVSSILEHTADDGKKYQTKYYNLDAIIAVGWRDMRKILILKFNQKLCVLCELCERIAFMPFTFTKNSVSSAGSARE